MVRLSAVIITFNEARNIARCIDSLAGIADEIVVVDSNSTDDTANICHEKGVRFIVHDFEGYIQQKNFALKQASNNYLLSLDADEALSEELKTSIRTVKTQWTHDAYAMNRLTNYCGKWVRHGGWYPDRKVRLFKRAAGQWGGINPHDEFLLSTGTSLGFLRGDLLHYSYYTKTDHLRQIDRFSELGAKALFDFGKKSGPFKMTYKPIARFFKHYIFQAGFLDGATGWTIAWNSAIGVYKKYRWLYEWEKGKRS